MQALIENVCRQAEAVADLIASRSAATHRMAMNQMRGDFSRRLLSLREKLLKLTSLMELELDFSDYEEQEFSDRNTPSPFESVPLILSSHRHILPAALALAASGPTGRLPLKPDRIWRILPLKPDRIWRILPMKPDKIRRILPLKPDKNAAIPWANK